MNNDFILDTIEINEISQEKRILCYYYYYLQMQGKSLNEMWKDYEKVLATVENWREQYKKFFADGAIDDEEECIKMYYIITKDKESLRKLSPLLKEKIKVLTFDREDILYKGGKVLIPAYYAKGLEFDGVILADGESYLSIEDKHLFYTACTRALHELHIYTNTSLENILPQDNSLYTLIDN